MPLEEPPVSIHQGGTPALYDLTTIIGASFQQNMEPTQGGYIPKRLVNKLVPLLQMKSRLQSYDHNNLSVDMLFNIASQLNLLKLSRSSGDGAKPRYIEGSHLRQWSQKNEQEMVRDLLDHWMDSKQWIDIAGLNYDSKDSYDSFYYMNFQSGRKELLSYLRSCTPGKWYTIPSLLRTIKQENPYLLRNKMYQTGVAGYRNAKTILTKWFSVDGEILVGMLSSSLYEMGIVALGYDQLQPSQNGSHPSNPVAFMVTELGAAALATKSESKRVAAEIERLLILHLLMARAETPSDRAAQLRTDAAPAGYAHALSPAALCPARAGWHGQPPDPDEDEPAAGPGTGTQY